ncbi:MAG TPA: ABC transporter permease, partial [Methylomirabilota bacterium]|nr:ABC transporter permease [Methylomirabilota bacterium]
MRTALTRGAAVLGALALWAVIAHGNALAGVVNPLLLPAPAEVGRVALDLAGSGELGRHFVTSLGRVLQGFGLAALAALGLGLLVGVCVPLRLMTEPVIEFVRPIPP